MNRKKVFLWWKICLTILGFLGVIMSRSNIDWYNLSNNYLDFSLFKEVCYDLSVGVLSAMILIWFIDEINEHIQDYKSKNKELDEIRRSGRLLQLYIERYELFYYCIVTPIKQRDFKNITVPEEFMLKDMCDLYKTTLLTSEGNFSTAIECFLLAEAELKAEIESTIRNVNFEYFLEIRKCLEEFIEVSLRYNQKRALLEAKTTTVGNETTSKIVSEALKTMGDEFYEKFKKGEDQIANLMHPYVFLYEMLIGQYNVMKKYEKEMERINSNLK